MLVIGLVRAEIEKMFPVNSIVFEMAMGRKGQNLFISQGMTYARHLGTLFVNGWLQS